DLSLYKLKRYFWSLFGVIGVVALWAGVWDGVGYLPYLSNPLISLIVGLAILIFSGLIFKEFDPFADSDNAAALVLNKLKGHRRKNEFEMKYHDRMKNKHISINASKMKGLEKSFVVFQSPHKEIFIPLHRVKEITHKGKTHWKA
ncbi:MAG: DUF504 domain-containing protein, partial [Nanoarchaeota archaeon]|nr:DUF504 domain-containing protein [Nanoarchaeota archaeon]